MSKHACSPQYPIKLQSFIEVITESTTVITKKKLKNGQKLTKGTHEISLKHTNTYVELEINVVSDHCIIFFSVLSNYILKNNRSLTYNFFTSDIYIYFSRNLYVWYLNYSLL